MINDSAILLDYLLTKYSELYAQSCKSIHPEIYYDILNTLSKHIEDIMKELVEELE